MSRNVLICQKGSIYSCTFYLFGVVVTLVKLNRSTNRPPTKQTKSNEMPKEGRKSTVENKSESDDDGRSVFNLAESLCSATFRYLPKTTYTGSHLSPITFVLFWGSQNNKFKRTNRRPSIRILPLIYFGIEFGL